MKYFIDAITAVLAFKETALIPGFAIYLQPHAISMLLHLEATLPGFYTAVALYLSSGMYIFLLSSIFCSLVLFFLFILRGKISSPPA